MHDESIAFCALQTAITAYTAMQVYEERSAHTAACPFSNVSTIESFHFLAHAGFECPGSDIMIHSAGRVRFSPDGNEPHYVGTVATFTCEDGYVLLPVGGGGSTRRCQIGGWNGTNPTCSKLLVSSWSPNDGGIESVECSTGMEWWNGIVE